MMVHNRFNYNQNQGEGAPVKRDSSADSLTGKEKSVSRSVRDGGNDGGAAAGGGAAGGGGGAAAKKSGFTIAKIIAIVALVLALIAMGLSIYCTLLWWDWPWVITAPALVLAIVALIFAFAFKGHDEAVLCCAAIGAILALAALIWCSVEIAWCNSYQGSLTEAKEDGKTLLEQYEEKKTGGGGGRHRRGSGGGSELEALAFLYEKGHLCRGRIFDWSYKKEKMKLKTDCKRKFEKWFMGKYLSKGKSSYCTKDVKHGDTHRRPPKDGDADVGVDTYEQSPIHKTHADIVEGNKMRYPKYPSLHSENSWQGLINEFCMKFDKEVDKFIDARKKCDDEVKAKLKPKCKKELGGMLYTTSEEDYDKIKNELCKFGENEFIFKYSKFAEAVGRGVKVRVPNQGFPEDVEFTEPKKKDRKPKPLDETDIKPQFGAEFCTANEIPGVSPVPDNK